MRHLIRLELGRHQGLAQSLAGLQVHSSLTRAPDTEKMASTCWPLASLQYLECVWLLRCGLIWCSDTLYSPPVSRPSGVWRLGTVLGKRELTVPAWFHLLMISPYSESVISSGIGQFSSGQGRPFVCFES